MDRITIDVGLGFFGHSLVCSIRGQDNSSWITEDTCYQLDLHSMTIMDDIYLVVWKVIVVV